MLPVLRIRLDPAVLALQRGERLLEEGPAAPEVALREHHPADGAVGQRRQLVVAEQRSGDEHAPVIAERLAVGVEVPVAAAHPVVDDGQAAVVRAGRLGRGGQGGGDGLGGGEHLQVARGIVAVGDLGLADHRVDAAAADLVAVGVALQGGERAPIVEARLHVGVEPGGRLARAGEPGEGLAPLLAAEEVLADDGRARLVGGEGVVAAGGAEPVAGEAVAEHAVALGEHGVRPLAQERVAEGVLVLAAGAGAAHQDFAIDEPLQPATAVAAGVVVIALAEQGQGAGRGEDLAEDAGRAEQAPGRGGHRLEPGLDHAEHRLRQALASAGGVGADQLFQVEGVAGRLVAEPRQIGRGDGRAGRVEREAHQLLRGAAGERAEADALQAALAPQRGEALVHLRPGQGEHHQGLVLEIAQGLVDELDSRRRRPSAGPPGGSARGAARTGRGGRRRRRG